MKNTIRAEREAQGMTQTELAQSLAVSRQTIHAIETGKYVLSTILALKLARIFNKQVEELFELQKGD